MDTFLYTVWGQELNSVLLYTIFLLWHFLGKSDKCFSYRVKLILCIYKKQWPLNCHILNFQTKWVVFFKKNLLGIWDWVLYGLLFLKFLPNRHHGNMPGKTQDKIPKPDYKSIENCQERVYWWKDPRGDAPAPGLRIMDGFHVEKADKNKTTRK